MAFNGNTYRANRYAKASVEYLAKARDIKARAARGEGYDWEVKRIPNLAKLAISAARLSRGYRRLAHDAKLRATQK